MLVWTPRIFFHSLDKKNFFCRPPCTYSPPCSLTNIENTFCCFSLNPHIFFYAGHKSALFIVCCSPQWVPPRCEILRSQKAIFLHSHLLPLKRLPFLLPKASIRFSFTNYKNPQSLVISYAIVNIQISTINYYAQQSPKWGQTMRQIKLV